MEAPLTFTTICGLAMVSTRLCKPPLGPTCKKFPRWKISKAYARFVSYWGPLIWVILQLAKSLNPYENHKEDTRYLVLYHL